MDLTLVRKSKESDGIFSDLLDSDGNLVASCLEHAYQQPDGSWGPKVFDGTFVCHRGMHQLEGMTHPFETFEITGVTGHTNILFHTGNTNKDSAGCVLLGEKREGAAVVNSRVTFAKFMVLQKGIQSFNLAVK